jgi:hypothetical protein
MDIESLKYPIGKFTFPTTISEVEVKNWINDIASFPGSMKSEVVGLSAEQLEWKYRPDGWCIRQVVHHCADSHINSQMRFKLALTEDNPTIKPYEEALWAMLPDMDSPVEWSLELLENLHKRWVRLLENLSMEDLQKTYIHPEHNRTFTLGQTIALYSWHSRHHLQHVKNAIASKGSY